MAKSARITNHQQTIHPIADEIAERLVDKLTDIKKPFNKVLDISSIFDGTSHLLSPQSNVECFQSTKLGELLNKEEVFDLVISNLSFTITKDMQKALLISGKTLKKDGLLIASILGAESFKELKESFYAAGSKNGHTALFPDVQTCGSLLHQLKFALPVIDREFITLHYSSFKEMWQDIRSLGKLNNHPEKRKGLTTPDLWRKMEKHYWENFATPEGYIPLTLEVIYLTGWRADKSQQKPLPMGTKAVSLAEILK
jgi:NADH dehydrogenase [ubiquinone] 1 alpha subcomplex assembly factor 5